MSFTKESYNPVEASAWLVCTACGTQFPSSSRSTTKTCFICDDPRQFVPPTGQSFTTLQVLRDKHHNEFVTYEADPRLTSIHTVPKLGIGQRAILVKTPKGNILWDCLALLDDDTVEKITAMGGLKAVVISHPHYYTTHVQWGRAFGCPVYLAEEDMCWTTMKSTHQVPITQTETPILDTTAIAIKLGGHFPGSLVLLFDGRLFIADTLVTTPSGRGKWEVDGNGDARERPPGMNTFTFQWSIPNMIPLSVEEMARMWGILKGYEFRSTHGHFLEMDVEDGSQGGQVLKGRVLESMQIQTKYMGYVDHAFMKVTL